MAEGQGRSSNQGVKLLYIRDYLHKYTNKEHPKSAKKICEYLASKGIKADRKTIYNDILRLQVDFQEPIEYNSKKWGYYITKPRFSNYELRMLLDSVYTSERLTAEETSKITDKILEQVNIYDREYFLEELKQRAPRKKAENSITCNAQIVSDAIMDNKKISYLAFDYSQDRKNNNKCYLDQYFAPNEKKIPIIISPQKLVWQHGNYRVVRYIEGNPSSFPLEHMEDIKILSQDGECSKPQNNSKNKSYPAPRFKPLVVERDGYTIDYFKEYAVTFLVKEIHTRKIFEYWGYDTPIIDYDNGQYERRHVMFTVRTDLPSAKFINWMIQFGVESRILAPKEAIGEWVQFLNDKMRPYGYGTPDYLKDVPTSYDEMRAQKYRIR